MDIGDVIESGIWLTGDESIELRKRFEADVTQAVEDLCLEHGVIGSPVKFYELRPEEDRVPNVPDHITGQRVRLLVAESVVVGIIPQTNQASFIANLDIKDLHRLRTITRKASGKTLSDKQCDELIEQYGPEAALDTLRKNVGVSVH